MGTIVRLFIDKILSFRHLPKTLAVRFANSRTSLALSNGLFLLNNKTAYREKYFTKKSGPFQRKAVVAVVLHLYHPELWRAVFLARLQFLAKKVDFDLFITMPVSNISSERLIRESFPDVNILIVPNRGRDVLPFIKTVQVLRSKGYKKVLKLHTKKSTHRDDKSTSAESGDAWLNNTLDSILPSNSKALEEIIKILMAKDTGMIGPMEYYYPLKMYLSHNRLGVERIMRSIDRSFFKGIISEKVDSFGYFGGTMFWADLETINSAVRISKRNFQKEKGQTDGTTAHALERVLCLVGQSKGKKIIGASRGKLITIKPHMGTLPKWYFDDVSSGKPHISIIVPVYGDWSSLSVNIKSLRRSIGNSEYVSVHYINDCGPEVETMEENILKNIAGLTNFFYYRNDENKGFVRTCNRGVFEIVDQSSDVLLLNSDTRVTTGFVDAMRAVMYSDTKIGAVTARSNNATIWSVPMTGRLANHRVLAYVFYRFIRHSLPVKYITPTIHGFCVLIRRATISKYGLFDEIYGKGYGEENDFAMRIRKNGWKCAVANHAFVFHYESRSFGKEVRNKQIETNEKILLKRYPHYRDLVQEYWNGIREPLK